MKSWSNWIWVSKVTPDFFLWCWTWILCSHCLGKQKSHCGQDFKQHLKEWFLCTLWESQPFVQMKTEPNKYALLIRNVLNAVLYRLYYYCILLKAWKDSTSTTSCWNFVCLFVFKAKKKAWFVFYLCGTSCVLVGWDFIWFRVWNQTVWFLFNIRQYFNVTGYKVP